MFLSFAQGGRAVCAAAHCASRKMALNGTVATVGFPDSATVQPGNSGGALVDVVINGR